jgi:segregation and condensation protein A
MTPAAGGGSAREREGDAFAVELPVFAGPFKLLADLILDQKIDVCDVPIATVTDGFLAHSKRRRAGRSRTTWFLAVCAVLLELRSAG